MVLFQFLICDMLNLDNRLKTVNLIEFNWILLNKLDIM
jgi:hypothetical protein